jgi:hypothetical protein
MNYLRAQLVRVLVDYCDADDRRMEHALRGLHHSECIAADCRECGQDRQYSREGVTRGGNV